MTRKPRPLTRAQLRQARKQLARRAAKARWKRTTPEQRSEYGRWRVSHREDVKEKAANPNQKEKA